MPSTLPKEVHSLLEGPVDSFEKLEVLVALALDPAMHHNLKTLAEQLRLDLPTVRQSVLGLEASGLVQRDLSGDVRLLAPDRVAPLVAAYDEDRLGIVIAISGIAMRRIRGLTARAFANAFDLRKKRGEGDG